MTKRLYDDNLYRFDSPQPSYWEATASDIAVNAPPLEGDDSCDVAIIGGGYTGLSAALHLARDYDIDVRVLEAGHIGWAPLVAMEDFAVLVAPVCTQQSSSRWLVSKRHEISIVFRSMQ